jgi:hypothetical protein
MRTTHVRAHQRSRVFDTSTLKGLEAAERYKNQMQEKHNKVDVTTAGFNRVKIVTSDPSLFNKGTWVKLADGSIGEILTKPENGKAEVRLLAPNGEWDGEHILASLSEARITRMPKRPVGLGGAYWKDPSDPSFIGDTPAHVEKENIKGDPPIYHVFYANDTKSEMFDNHHAAVAYKNKLNKEMKR